MDKGFLFFSLVIIFIIAIVSLFERRRVSVKEMAVIAVLAALAALGRIPFAALPSVQPTTFIVIISGYVFGGMVGFLVGISTAFVSNIFLGHGPWTIIQMLAWGLCGLSAGYLGRWQPNASKRTLLIFGLGWGYMYGWITNLWFWLAFVYPITFKSWVLTNVNSFWFDSVHAITNAVFFYFLGSDFIKILKRFQLKLTYTEHTYRDRLNPLDRGELTKASKAVKV